MFDQNIHCCVNICNFYAEKKAQGIHGEFYLNVSVTALPMHLVVPHDTASLQVDSVKYFSV